MLRFSDAYADVSLIAQEKLVEIYVYTQGFKPHTDMKKRKFCLLSADIVKQYLLVCRSRFNHAEVV
jgi:hypothetical protein